MFRSLVPGTYKMGSCCMPLVLYRRITTGNEVAGRSLLELDPISASFLKRRATEKDGSTEGSNLSPRHKPTPSPFIRETLWRAPKALASRFCLARRLDSLPEASGGGGVRWTRDRQGRGLSTGSLEEERENARREGREGQQFGKDGQKEGR